jgi:hypothetical protein
MPSTHGTGANSLSVADLFFHTELCSSMGPVEAGNWLRSSIGPAQTDDWLAANVHADICSQSVSEATAGTQTFKGLQRRYTMERQLRLQVEQNFVAVESIMALTPSDGPSCSALSSAATSRHNSSSPVRLRLRSSSNTDHLKGMLGILQTKDMQMSAASPRPSEPTATSIHKHDFDGSKIAMLVQEHGDKAYLLFTDAAHQLLDSTTSLPDFEFKRTRSYSY